MYSFIQGALLSANQNIWTVAVGDARSFIGYSLHVPNNHLYMKTPGTAVSLYLYTHYREQGSDLFGFHTFFEKELFLDLISVNGVGPKVGLSLLSAFEPETLVRRIIDRDQVPLTKVSGVGKKTAERIVVELSEKLDKKFEQRAYEGGHGIGRFAGVLGQPSMQSSPNFVHENRVAPDIEAESSGHAIFVSGPTAEKAIATISTKTAISIDMLRDARLALEELGYREIEVREVIQKIMKDDNQPKSTQDVVLRALREWNGARV